ncbi:ABC transporter substrate-binding protein [Virgibacillus litoralis]|uniref:Peptide/nickel transport system substrate-binding protein n=1 Tax=Virgibacillus litoralis TaxID=578221 RepID=A0ABS4HC22_9BACI|nr:ABC transporter substrate-binding protein [Virgibacillus litoralis]MBP1948047.1 peptide/nickel transport system substrate-binding protein [Virgibacillus litoralis]
MLKKIFLFFLLLIVAVVVAACSDDSETTADGEDGGEEAAEQVLKIANDQEPAGLDPHKTPAHSSVRVYSKVYEGLVTFDENMEIKGQLAKDWEQPDDSTYIFNLVEGVKFHNGREMTAEDVLYSFERIMDEETASHISSYFSDVENIEVMGDYKIKFELAAPNATFLSHLTNSSAAIVPKEVVEENGDLQQVAVGTGPFVFEEWVPDSSVTLSKNEDYYIEDVPKLDRVEYYTMKEEAARLSAIRTGEIDMTTLTAKSTELLEGEDAVNIKGYQSLEYSYIGFNVDKEPFNNKKVRQALSLATDRQNIADVVWDGEAIITGPIAPAMGDWSIDVEQEELYQRDLEKAKELLAEAGYPDGFSTEITTASTYADMVDTAQLLQQQWKEIGVNAEIKQIEWGEYIDTWSNTSADILVGRNGSGTDPDRAMNYFFHTDGSANVWNFSNEEYDAIVEKGKRTIDQEKRKDIYVEAQEKLLDLSPNLFLVSPENYVAVRDGVKDFTPYAHNGEDIDHVYKK